MNTVVRCSRGHRWEVKSPRQEETPQLICPVCGAMFFARCRNITNTSYRCATIPTLLRGYKSTETRDTSQYLGSLLRCGGLLDSRRSWHP